MLKALRRPRSRKEEVRENPDYTKNIARERLQTAITRDRFDLVPPELLEALRRDMLLTISRHLEVGGDGFQEFEIRRFNQSLFLVSNIRIKNLPRWALAQ